MFEQCEDCTHPIGGHVGVVDMGGGHSEAIGCTFVDETGELCDCLRYEGDDNEHE